MRIHRCGLRPPSWDKKGIIGASLIASALSGLASPAHSLDLVQSYRLALTQDAGYQASRAETAGVRENVPMALAQLLPNISGNLTRSKNYTNRTVSGFSSPMNAGQYEYFSANYALTLRQPLYRKYNFAQYRQAQSQVASVDASLEKSLQDLLVRLSATYFEALLAQDQMALVLAQKEAYGVQLKAVQHAFEAGLGTRTDIDDAQVRYDMSLAQELEASHNLGQTRRQLSVIVNQPVNTMAPLDPGRMELVGPKPVNPEEWIARGEEENAELRAMRANIESAREELEKAKAGHWPMIDLIAQRSRSISASETTIDQRYLTTTVGVQINIPLFAGGYYVSQERQALANIERSRHLYDARRREVGQQIRQEFETVAEGVLKVKALEQAERSADQAVFSNQKGVKAGTRTLVDMFNAQQQRVNVRRDLAKQRYVYIMARVRLQGMVNSLDENEITLINSWLSDSPITVRSAN